MYHTPGTRYLAVDGSRRDVQRVAMYQEREEALEPVGLSEQGAHADS